MSLVVLLKLIAIFAVVALGWIAGRARWLGAGDTSRTLSAAAFHLFVPALLFRTTARLDLRAMPWSTVAAFFVPTMAGLLAVYALQRSRRQAAPAASAASDVPPAGDAADDAPAAVETLPAAPAVRAIGVSFGNTVQLGIPMAQALFGEAGLSVHLAIVSLHALTILTVVTLLVEIDLARAQARNRGVRPRLGATLRSTVRATVIHPVVLPVLAGLGWNLARLPLPELVDETLLMLGQAVVPLCLVIIGISLEQHGLKGAVRGASWIAAGKLLGLPALVLVGGRWGAGLHGVALATIVMCAALPVGSNALLFAQRYRTLEGETNAAIVLSTFAFVVTAPWWLLVVGWVG
jgi:malonate transporter